MDRRNFIATVAKAGMASATFGAVLGVAGCGGGGGGNSNTQTIRTSGSGRVEDVVVGPDPGAVFIPLTTQFQIEWPDGNPPRSFDVRLHRFREPVGGQSIDLGTQAITIQQVNGSTWNVFRRDNFDLDSGGVYYVEVTAAGSQPQYFAYIASSNRSVTENPGTGGFLSDVLVSPRAGSCFIAKDTDFTLQWTGAAPPPSQFTASIRRYKEPRGSDNGGDSEQESEIFQQGSDFIWTFRRKSNFNMDGNAAYYIEITAPGQGVYRSAFITGNV